MTNTRDNETTNENLVCGYNPNTTIIPQTSVQFQSALTLYKQRPDKEWSQTDCVSFKIMEEQAIAEALAYDKHFVQAGYQAMMRNCQGKNSSN